MVVLTAILKTAEGKDDDLERLLNPVRSSRQSMAGHELVVKSKRNTHEGRDKPDQ